MRSSAMHTPAGEGTENSFSAYLGVIQKRARQLEDSRWRNTSQQVQRDDRFDKKMHPTGTR